jgi:NAD(P)-dependent dehydrogenase (short-subunit alcohol dehydrogenase family)
VVTGGSRGIGRGIAERLAKEGYDLLLVASNQEHLDAAREAIETDSQAKVGTYAADLRKEGSGEAVLNAVMQEHGRVDVLVNCAGATKGGRFPDQDEEIWQDGFALKFFGAVRVCRALWPELVRARGTVVNIVGGFARKPSADFMIGGAVNAALANFSKALAEQGIRDDVNVNAIHPGVTRSERMSEIITTRSRLEGVSEDEIRENLAKNEGVRRIGEPEDVAALVAFLCRPEARHIQGTAIAIDGGTNRCVY